MRTTLVTLAAASALTLTACSSGPSADACKTAMKAGYALALTTGRQATEPAACKGLPPATLASLAGQIMAGQ